MPNSPPTTGGIINKGITAHQNINAINTRSNSGSSKAASTNVQVLEKVSRLSGAEHMPGKENTARAAIYRNADRARARSNKMPAKTYLMTFTFIIRWGRLIHSTWLSEGNQEQSNINISGPPPMLKEISYGTGIIISPALTAVNYRLHAFFTKKIKYA
jgi:hypothetical protein